MVGQSARLIFCLATQLPGCRACSGPVVVPTATGFRRFIGPPYLWSVKTSRRLLLALLAPGLALVTACSSPNQPIAENGQPTPASAAQMALMARHDSLMAQMDQLFALKAKIAAAHAPAAGPYLRGLAAADAAMMGWMHQYRAPDTTAAAAARLAYFQQQQQVLAKVSRQFRATMDSASLFIKQLPAPLAAPIK